jgi:hypothetical protein
MFWSLPKQKEEAIRLGRVGLWWPKPYTLSNSARTTHLYCIGSSGQGKSKFLESLIVQDIVAGRGVGLVDPHTDLARDTLAHLLSLGFFNDPKNYERVIYLDPTRTDFIIPFNVLNLPLQPYDIAQQIIEAFRRTWPQALAEAPRFTNIALAALLVLIETGQTLIEMPLLLTDKEYREQLLSQIHNQDVLDYFHNRFDRWEREAAVMTESVLNKVTAFSFNPYLKHVLGATENRLDFRPIMDGGKVLIVDLGNCDGETRRLLGSLVVTGIEMAALSRKGNTARRAYHFFIDEFQDFSANEGAAKTLAQILSECRKFGLHLHLAHQTLGQLHNRISSALGNVGIKIVFSVDREDAEILAPKLFGVDTEAVKHEAGTDTQHPLYKPLNEQWEKATATIQNLTPRFALVKERGAAVVKVRTETIRPYRVSSAQVDELLKDLARTHGEPLASMSRPTRSQPQARAPIPSVDIRERGDTLSFSIYDSRK